MIPFETESPPLVCAPAPIRFKDYTADELYAQLSGLGVTARLARRLQAVVVRQGAAQIPGDLPEVSRRMLNRVVVPLGGNGSGLGFNGTGMICG